MYRHLFDLHSEGGFPFSIAGNAYKRAWHVERKRSITAKSAYLLTHAAIVQTDIDQLHLFAPVDLDNSLLSF